MLAVDGTLALTPALAGLALGGLALAGAAAFVAHRLGFPYLVALAAAGMLEAHFVPAALHIPLDPRLLGLFLPALIFEGALDLDLAMLRRTWRAIFLLAGPGVILTAAVVALAARASGALPFASALVLGAIVAATDPVAVLGIFRRAGVPRELRTIVEGESIANDGFAAILVASLVGIALRAPAPNAAGALAASAAVQVVASTVVGILFGIAAAAIASVGVRALRGSRAGILVTLALAYGAYFGANALGASGILAVAVAGIAIGPLTPGERVGLGSHDVDRFWDGAAFFANAVVFLLVGLNIDPAGLGTHAVAIGTILIATLVARAALAYVLVPIGEPHRGTWRHAVFLAGMRGGLAAALAIGLPAALVGRSIVVEATFAVVVMTLVVQGGLVGPALRAARLAPAGATGA